MEIDWNAGKAKSNLAKHGVSFEEAGTVFEPARPAIFDDLEHSDRETRYIAIGFSGKNRLLVVSFVRRSGRLRIISAPKATKKESVHYAQAKRYET
jgi:uncharacterized DUF497 family protein